MADQEQCNDPSLWGKGIYITLKEIVEGYMDGLTPDNHTYDIERRFVLKQARNAIKEFNFSSVKKYISVELELRTSLQVELPVDYVDYYKISWIDEEGTTYPMVQNGRLSLGQAILQDHEYNFICDSDGQWVTVDGTSPTIDDPSPIYSSGYNTDRSMIFENGYFNVDKNVGVIKFGSDAKEKKILLEYITDGYSGMDDSEIKIHKYASNAVDEFIYFRLIERNRNVIATEKQRARRSLNIAVRKMKNRMNPVREEDLYQLVRARSRWIKQI